MEIKLDKKTKIKIFAFTLIVVLITVIGVSYAYISLNIQGNEEASSVSVDIARLELTFTDGNVVNISGIFTGTTVSKTFSVTNNTSAPTYYDIKMSDVYTTFIKDELVYTLTSTNSGATKTETIMPNNDGLIKSKVLIAGNTTQTYTMNITWKEMNDYQNYNQNATYHGKIQILSPYTYTNGNVNNIKLVDRIMLDNTEAYPTNTSSKYVTSVSGINYKKSSDNDYNGYYTYIEDVNFTSSSNKALGTGFTYVAPTKYLQVNGTTSTSQTYSQSSVGKYTCNTSSTSCNQPPFEAYKILEVSGSTVTKVERYVAKPDKASWNGLGLYQTSTNTVNNNTTYFFRGHVINNYVLFAGDVWRIVRINEDGSIRLIRENSYSNAKFNTTNTTRDNEMYVGYMFGTSADPYVNTNPSNIKTQVEAYYDSKLASYSSYLAPIEFCNDRTIASTSSSDINYGAISRLYGAAGTGPVFTCPNEARDLFTLTTSSRGNKKLTKSVGLLSADEASYAGTYYGSFSDFYLYENGYWWTSTPFTFAGSISRGFSNSLGRATNTSIDGSLGVRPVISLKADTLVLGGSGSANDPYIITQ